MVIESRVMKHARTILAVLLVLPVLAVGQAPATDPGPERESNISPFAIDIPESMRVALRDVQDKGPWQDAVLAEMVDLVAGMDQVGPSGLESLERPHYQRLLTYPAHWRAQRISLPIFVAAVTKIEPSRQFPTAKAFWVLQGFSAQSPEGYQDRPLVVISTTDPTALLGQPDREDSRRGTKFFTTRESIRKLQIAAILYKIAEGETFDLATGAPDDTARFPVFVTNQLGVDSGQVAGQDKTLLYIIAGAVLALLGGFYLLFRKVLAQRSARNTRQYEPLRDEQEIEAAARESQEEEVEDGPVDEELAAAAREYRQREGYDKDDTN